MFTNFFFSLTTSLLHLASLSLFFTSRLFSSMLFTLIPPMASRFVLVQFILIFFLISGSSIAESQPEATERDNLINQEDYPPFLSATSTRQLDTVPIVNPTTPGTTPPIVNPIESPPAPIAGTTTPINPPTTTTPTTSGGQWCIANPNAQSTALQVALDYACGYGGADCSAIQLGGSCYEQNTVRDHASYAFNDYYKKNPAPTSCVFGGTAMLTSTDPSSGICQYASSRSTPSISPPVNPTPTITTPTTMAPPDIMTPPDNTTPTVTTPNGPTVYGVAEPTGLPSSAPSVPCSLLLVLSAPGIMEFLVAAVHF